MGETYYRASINVQCLDMHPHLSFIKVFIQIYLYVIYVSVPDIILVEFIFSCALSLMWLCTGVLFCCIFLNVRDTPHTEAPIIDKNTDGEFKFQSSHWILAKINKHLKENEWSSGFPTGIIQIIIPISFPVELHIVETHSATSDTLFYYQILLKQILPSLLSVTETEDQPENYSTALSGKNPDTQAGWWVWCLFHTHRKELWISEMQCLTLQKALTLFLKHKM